MVELRWFGDYEIQSSGALIIMHDEENSPLAMHLLKCMKTIEVTAKFWQFGSKIEEGQKFRAF